MARAHLAARRAAGRRVALVGRNHQSRSRRVFALHPPHARHSLSLSSGNPRRNHSFLRRCGARRAHQRPAAAGQAPARASSQHAIRARILHSLSHDAGPHGAGGNGSRPARIDAREPRLCACRVRIRRRLVERAVQVRLHQRGSAPLNTSRSAKLPARWRSPCSSASQCHAFPRPRAPRARRRCFLGRSHRMHAHGFADLPAARLPGRLRLRVHGACHPHRALHGRHCAGQLARDAAKRYEQLPSGRMIIIERFKRGATPRHQPTAQTVSIRIDTS